MRVLCREPKKRGKSGGRGKGKGSCSGELAEAERAATDADLDSLQAGHLHAISLACWGVHARRNGACMHDGGPCGCVQGMGFSRAKAQEALEECGYRLNAAVNWLLSNCT